MSSIVIGSIVIDNPVVSDPYVNSPDVNGTYAATQKSELEAATCTVCCGSKIHKCNVCQGSGNIRCMRCFVASADGKGTCSICAGLQKHRCNLCIQGQVSCAVCGGTGQRW